MSTKEAEIRLRIFSKLLPLSTNYKKCEPVIDEIYKICEKFENELDRSKPLPDEIKWDQQKEEA